MIRTVLRGALLSGWLVGCDDGGDSLTVDPDTGPITVTAVDMQSIQIRWTAVAGANSYVLERRADLKGAFAALDVRFSRNQLLYLDRGLQPNTIYGYRLKALNDLGDEVAASTVGAARTAPEPGIEVTAHSVLGGDARFSIDSSGYSARVRLGTVDESQPIDVNGTQLFQPLQPGTYQVTLEDVASNCRVQGNPIRNVVVTGTGMNTIAKVAFDIACRDRTRGQVTASVMADGDTTDTDGFKLALTGFASEPGLPDSLRAVVLRRDVGSNGGSALFENVRPGTYSLTIESVAPYCAVAGAVQHDDLRVTALGDVSQQFSVTCTAPGGGPTAPYLVRAVWVPDTSETGTKPRLQISLDLTGGPPVSFIGYQFSIRTLGGVVRTDSAVSAGGWNFTPNVQDETTVTLLGTRSQAITGGVVPLADVYYTVTGATGRTVRPQLIGLKLGQLGAPAFEGQAGVVLGLFTVGTKLGSSTNQPPVAHANGPYSGTTGSPISFSSAGSTDPDGTITSYRWDFGDGQSGTGPGPTHGYATAGAYTARLTVTDDKGAMASSTATVTVSGGGGGSSGPPFTWRAQFGSVNPADRSVMLTITLDLSTDIPETAGAEALASFSVPSLTWDKSVLEYASATLESGPGFVDFLEVFSNGRVGLQGSIDPAKSRGVITIAKVKFRVIGAAGSTTTTTTTLSSVISTAGTGSYEYRLKTKVEEATLSVPSGGGPTTTTVSGTVTSPQSGALSGATVTLSNSGGSATTGASGNYTISNVAAGSYTATLSGLPTGCTAPAPKSVTVASSPVTGVDFSVTCPAPAQSGTVNGQINFATGSATPSLSGVTVTITPNGGSALTTSPNATGAYSKTGVPVGSGTVAISTLPSGCSATSPSVQYSGLINGGTITASAFTLNCAAAAGQYEFTVSWSPIQAGQTTMTVKIDMTTYNDPQNNGSGPDALIGFQGSIVFPTSRLSNPACTAGQLTGVINVATAGDVKVVLSKVPGGVSGNNITIYTCTFSVTGTGPSSISVGTSLALRFSAPPSGSPAARDITSLVHLNLGSVP